MTAAPIPVEDQLAVTQQIARSHHLLDDRRWDELVDDVFAPADGDVEPWADFGFASWVGAEALRSGYAASLARFETAVHLTSNVQLAAEEDGRITGTYDVQGWHWLATTTPGTARPADFLLLGRTTDRFRAVDGEWRLTERSLRRHGPSVAVGALPDWLTGLGTTTAATGSTR